MTGKHERTEHGPRALAALLLSLPVALVRAVTPRPATVTGKARIADAANLAGGGTWRAVVVDPKTGTSWAQPLPDEDQTP